MTAYAIGGSTSVLAAPLTGKGAPTQNLKGQLGQFYFDMSVRPFDAYVYDGLTWQIGGNSLATTTIPGIVEIDEDLVSVPSTLSVVPSALAAKTYSDSVSVSVPSTPWSETVPGIARIATSLEAVGVTVDDVVITPLKAAEIFASPPDLGILTPSNGNVITLTVLGPALLKGQVIVRVFNEPVLLGTNNDNAAIKIGTEPGTPAGYRTIFIGSPFGTSSVEIQTGTGDLNIGTSAVEHAVNIGNTVGASPLNINSGSGNVNVLGDFNLTSSASKISIKGGQATDFIGSGTLVSGTATINNTNISSSDCIVVRRSSRNSSNFIGHFIYTIVDGVSFTINSYNDLGVLQNADVSSFVYVIYRQT